ncbi:hypothetical protein P879_00348 [Paragonimus westermani]|uniref:Uncharacterized protein n=1 Tax=Paragonimus westermani TaxID=34504 RepID=A0A8T0DZ28_9TREM|nr:hypothetical protein P879_00348 [Paragonimus westermani]
MPPTTRPFTLRDFLSLSGLAVSSTHSSTMATGGVQARSTSGTNFASSQKGVTQWKMDPLRSSQNSVELSRCIMRQNQLSSEVALNRAGEKVNVAKQLTALNILANKQLPQTRPILRRSNTVGASNIGTRLPNSVWQESTPQDLHVKMSGNVQSSSQNYPNLKDTGKRGLTNVSVVRSVADRVNSQQLIRQLLSQTGRTTSNLGFRSNQQIDQSPTERVIRKCGHPNTSSLDRGTTVYPRHDLIRQNQLTADAILNVRNVDADPYDAAMKGRRARLRREYTIDGGTGSVSQTPQSTVCVSPEQQGQRPEEKGKSIRDPGFKLPTSDQHTSQSIMRESFDDRAPEELYFTSERFQGRTLVQWLSHQLARTGNVWSYNLISLVAHICTCLLRLGVLQLDNPNSQSSIRLTRPAEYNRTRFGLSSSLPSDNVFGSMDHCHSLAPRPETTQNPVEIFDVNRYYKWTGVNSNQLLKILQGHDRSTSCEDNAGSVPLDKDFYFQHPQVQIEFDGLRQEYEYEMERLTREHELQLFRVKNQGVMKACQLTDRIEFLEQEVEKYRILAGIEHLTKSPMMDDMNSRGVRLGRTGEMAGKFNHPTSADNNFRNYSLDFGKSHGQKGGFNTTYFSSPSPICSPLHRPRANSEAVSAVNFDTEPSFCTQYTQVNPLKQETMEVHTSELTADELPRTKGFLRRLKEVSSGADSGISGSKSSMQDSRADSQDTAERSVASVSNEGRNATENDFVESRSLLSKDMFPPCSPANRGLDISRESSGSTSVVKQNLQNPPSKDQFNKPFLSGIGRATAAVARAYGKPQRPAVTSDQTNGQTQGNHIRPF